MPDNVNRKKKFQRIIIVYPFALIVIGLLINFLAFGIAPAEIALPDQIGVAALAMSAVLLLGNHTWLMTSTELARLQHDLHATPEEWHEAGLDKEKASQIGLQELERRHNAHRNATENTVYFAIFAGLLSLISPAPLAAAFWMLAFAIGRLGHTFSYLTGRDSLRGIFMSLSLTSLYGMASYALLAIGIANL
ncbi:MAPEG family protein [Pelagimonas phthalicica]|uniref:MAPEG family protein n=1 Tax=Pelagimonas phthalicica TaxID=1037362 RepID=A0A238JD23_9RHOB|nr:MAPEG family protein [Pelagimonas phthalicica]SMX28578.1 MAPEG family protein [Pelagimonas phthalicica]